MLVIISIIYRCNSSNFFSVNNQLLSTCAYLIELKTSQHPPSLPAFLSARSTLSEGREDSVNSHDFKIAIATESRKWFQISTNILGQYSKYYRFVQLFLPFILSDSFSAVFRWFFIT